MNPPDKISEFIVTWSDPNSEIQKKLNAARNAASNPPQETCVDLGRWSNVAADHIHTLAACQNRLDEYARNMGVENYVNLSYFLEDLTSPPNDAGAILAGAREVAEIRNLEASLRNNDLPTRLDAIMHRVNEIRSEINAFIHEYCQSYVQPSP